MKKEEAIKHLEDMKKGLFLWDYVKWKIEKYLDAAKEAIKKGEYLW